MERKMLTTIFAILIMLSLILLLPVQATKPEINDNIYFGCLALSVTDGDKTMTGDGTVIHNKGIESVFGLFYKTPSMSAAVNIGHMHCVTNFEFVITGTETKTLRIGGVDTLVTYYVGEGVTTGKWTIIFGENSQGNPTTVNPFGIGTIEGISVSKVTSTYTTADWFPGESKGLLVATHGTGDFENAKLMSDYTGYSIVSAPLGNIRVPRITVGFDGSTSALPGFPLDGIGTGVLTYHK